MIYFASDVHLGLHYKADSRLREEQFVGWLKAIERDCDELFLVGDIFDFWFEWKNVVPKGFMRVFGQLAHMSDNGTKIHFFVGNHDKWAKDYFKVEFNATIHHAQQLIEREGVNILIVHGDGLGKSDFLGRTLSRLFNSKSARWLFQRVLHPDTAMRFGKWWSKSNRHKRGNIGHAFKKEQEPIVDWAKNQLKTLYKDKKIDYVIIGHLHTPTIYQLTTDCKLVILGEWIENPMYATLSHGVVELKNSSNFE